MRFQKAVLRGLCCVIYATSELLPRLVDAVAASVRRDLFLPPSDTRSRGSSDRRHYTSSSKVNVGRSSIMRAAFLSRLGGGRPPSICE
eukprot:4556580-Amphidinium_carterae.1